MMIIVFSQPCTKSNNNKSPCLYSEKAFQSVVLRLREEMCFVDAGLGTARISMQDEPTGVPINRATSFENKVGAMDLVAGESLIKKKILDRFFMDLVAGESLIKERASARFNDLVGSTDVVAGEPLLLIPRRFRQKRAWMELNKIWRTNIKVKGLFFEKVKRGYSVAIAGFITFLPFRPRRGRKLENPRFTIKSIKPKKKKILVFIHGGRYQISKKGVGTSLKMTFLSRFFTLYFNINFFLTRFERSFLNGFCALPLLNCLKRENQILLSQLLLQVMLLVILKGSLCLGYLFMDELSVIFGTAVPGAAGGSGLGQSPLPGPSNGPPFFLAEAHEDVEPTQAGGLVVIPEGLDPEPLISDEDRIGEIREWEESQFNPLETSWARPNKRKIKISKMASIEKRIEGALRKRYSDRTISQYRGKWRKTAFISQRTNYSLQTTRLDQILNKDDITQDIVFKRILTAVKEGQIQLNPR